ncbi:two-component system histidine kinase PnpS [Defluviitalea phaphyphila]|uniref:two-component system histidine kinase PnpS n=1 Tax=Defluviitalea phaphyphila TaxID=1473580 RepID=UPI000730B039|nr:HAMP domain-containing sensor histidine kinase [Defluviitalea phaphyphila]
MKRKLLVTYIILIIFSCLVTGFFAIRTSQNYYYNRLNEELLVKVKLISDIFIKEINSNEKIDFQEFSKKYGEVVNGRLTIIDENGIVLGDSETLPETMENHINRLEITQAAKGEVGFSKRYSSTLGIYYMYIAYHVNVEKFSGFLRLSIPVTEISQMNIEIINYSVVGILIGIVIAFIIAFIFSKKISKPIGQLVMAAEEIAKGNYNKRVYLNGYKEIEKLAYTFNYMVKELKYSFVKFKNQNIKLESILNSMTEGIIAVDSSFHIMLINPKVYEIFSIEKDCYGKLVYEVIRNQKILEVLENSLKSQKYIVQELEFDGENNKILRVYANPIGSTEYKEYIMGSLLVIEDITKIKKLEQMRKDFVSNVSHELKTPLTSIRGFIDTLKNGAIEDKKVANRFLEIIDVESERLYRLIQDILYLSEIETREKDIDMNMNNVEDIIDEVFEILKPKADKKNIGLEKNIEKDIPFFYCNKDRIKQILINIIDNGIKYTEKGKVTLICKREGDFLKFIIKDTGIGIPKEHIPRLFERFYRVNKGRSRKMGGTGLGLSIVKHIVKLYNGSISVESNVGEGTIFTILLPLTSYKQ